LRKEEAATQRIKRVQAKKLKEEQKSYARIKHKVIILAKKQAKALEAIRRSLSY